MKSAVRRAWLRLRIGFAYGHAAHQGGWLVDGQRIVCRCGYVMPLDVQASLFPRG